MDYIKQLLVYTNNIIHPFTHNEFGYFFFCISILKNIKDYILKKNVKLTINEPSLIYIK